MKVVRHVWYAALLVSLIATSACRARQSSAEPPVQEAGPKSPWNENNIKWTTFTEGLKEAQTKNKRALLVVHTDWCPRCKEYADVFNDSTITKLSKNFVMIKANQDHEAALRTSYAPDGTYVPRTMILSPDGTIDTSKRGSNPKYQYFVAPNRPGPLAELMD